MTILEILEAHYVSTTRENRVVCKTCGILTEEILLGGEQSYRLGITHQAQVLEQHEQEAKAAALEEAADAMDADASVHDPLRLKSDWIRIRAAQLRKETETR